jgi:hypothetical protein
MIKTVTITGADDTVSPADLILISQRFPFVEWGILMNGKSWGGARFPSVEFINNLCRAVGSSPVPINLSMHLCGKIVQDILAGNSEFIDSIPGYIWSKFQRIQLNTHGREHHFNNLGAALLKKHADKTWIIQYDDVNNHVLTLCWQRDVENIAILYDVSHGAGLSPQQWPSAHLNVLCGYAGGLGPDNLKTEIPKIHSAATDRFENRNNVYWIDMETKVRTFVDESTSAVEFPGRDTFDLAKVRECLGIAEGYVTVKA